VISQGQGFALWQGRIETGMCEGVGLRVPLVEMPKYPFDHIDIVDELDNSSVAASVNTLKRIDLVDLLNQPGPIGRALHGVSPRATAATRCLLGYSLCLPLLLYRVRNLEVHMTEPNTLFILAKWGLKVVDGIFETHMWLLNEQEESMNYVSLHKTKSDRAYKGGEIVNIRLPSEEEIQAHQALLAKEGNAPMKSVVGRKIVEFKGIPKWNLNWPNAAKTNPMAYKGLGYIGEKS